MDFHLLGLWREEMAALFTSYFVQLCIGQSNYHQTSEKTGTDFEKEKIGFWGGEDGGGDGGCCSQVPENSRGLFFCLLIGYLCFEYLFSTYESAVFRKYEGYKYMQEITPHAFIAIKHF